MKLKLILVAVLSTLAVGCTPEADTPMSKISPSSSSRFTVERVGVLDDDLAYNNRRGIYIVRDEKSGKEYVGVSGVGISELGSHTVSNGKTSYQVSDER